MLTAYAVGSDTNKQRTTATVTIERTARTLHLEFIVLPSCSARPAVVGGWNCTLSTAQ